jgi:hypothetical protein
MITAEGKQTSRALRLSTVALGACAVVVAASRVQAARLDVPLLLVALAAFVVGTRLRARIPSTRATISHADTLLVVALLLYGGACAVLLACAAALCASLNSRRARAQVVFDAAAAPAATLLAVLALGLVLGASALGESNLTQAFAPHLLVAALAAVGTTVVNLLAPIPAALG